MEIIEFLRNELPVNITLEKVKTVDVLVKADKEYIHIEVNTGIPNCLHIRNFIYFSTLYSKKVQRGESYDYVTKFIHFIVEYNMGKIMEYWYNEDEEKVKEYKHLIMLDLKTDDLKQISRGDDFVDKFNDKLTDLNEQETFQSVMTYEEDQKLILNTEKKISYEEGVESGIEQGIKEEKIEIAKNMLSKGMDIGDISEVTGLSIEEIRKL